MSIAPHKFFAWAKTHAAAESKAKQWLPTSPNKMLEPTGGASKPSVSQLRHRARPGNADVSSAALDHHLTTTTSFKAMAAKPLIRSRFPANKTFGKTFGAATGVSAPSYNKKPASETTHHAAKPPL